MGGVMRGGGWGGMISKQGSSEVTQLLLEFLGMLGPGACPLGTSQ